MGGVEVGDLSEGVYAGVSAARGGEADRMAQDDFDGPLDERLDRLTIRLNLPTRIIGSVVRDC